MSRGPNQVNPKTMVVDNCQDLYLRSQLAGLLNVVGDVTQLPPGTGGTPGTIIDASNQAASDASTALTLSNDALTAANGVNVDIFATSAPSTRPGGGSLVSGDLWYQTSSGDIIGIYTWSGSAWTSMPMTSAVFAYIDAGKITTGTLSSINIVGNFIETQANVGTGTSPSVVTGTLMNTSGQFFSYGNTGLFFGIDPSIQQMLVGDTASGTYLLYDSGALTLAGGAFTAPTITGGTITGSVITSSGSYTMTISSGGLVWTGGSVAQSILPSGGELLITSGTELALSSAGLEFVGGGLLMNGYAISGVASLGMSGPINAGGNSINSCGNITLNSSSNQISLNGGNLVSVGQINGFTLNGTLNAGGNSINSCGNITLNSSANQISLNGGNLVGVEQINGFTLNGTLNGGSQTIQSSALTVTSASSKANQAGIGASGVLGTFSSTEVIKKQIRDIQHPEDIYKLRPVQFRWNRLLDDTDPELRWGFIAEEVWQAGVDPLVIERNGRVDGVQHWALTAPLLALSKQHHQQIAELTRRLDVLEHAA